MHASMPHLGPAREVRVVHVHLKHLRACVRDVCWGGRQCVSLATCLAACAQQRRCAFATTRARRRAHARKTQARTHTHTHTHTHLLVRVLHQELHLLVPHGRAVAALGRRLAVAPAGHRLLAWWRACACACVCVCVCVRVRVRPQIVGGGAGFRCDGSVCVCVCVCVWRRRCRQGLPQHTAQHTQRSTHTHTARRTAPSPAPPPPKHTHTHARAPHSPSTRRTQGLDCQGSPHTGSSRPSRSSTVSSPCV
jgi:hypothetical protein